MKKTGLLPSLLLLLLLVACGESHQQMVFQLEELERQNRADSLMLNDSLALRLADYFDRHGSANERLRAHYILGRTYADMGEAPAALEAYLDAAECADTTQADCDYHTLSRVYGQMAMVFYEQNLIENYLSCLNSSASYAWRDSDTLQALRGMAMKSGGYNRIRKFNKLITDFEEVFELLYKTYGKATAAQYSILPVNALFEMGKLEKAKYYLDIVEHESGFFDSANDIEKGREGFYYYKGRYFMAKQQYDSAEYYFRKELRTGLDFTNQSMASRGLSLVFDKMGIPDSAAKYAIYSYEMNDSVYAQMSTSEVERTAALYNYNRHQAIASREQQRADRESGQKNVLIVIVLASFIITIMLLSAWRKRRKAMLHQYERKVEELRRAKAELSNLHALESEKTNLQALSKELYSQIASKEATIADLQTEIGQLRKSSYPPTSESESQLVESDLYRRLHKSVKCEKLSEAEWQEIDDLVASVLPAFHRFVCSQYAPDSNEYRTCLLLRLNFRMQDASGFIGISKSRLSQISSEILDNVFSMKGSGKELQRRLGGIE